MDLILSIPVGSSECERGFSKMKALKTSYRNNLKSSTMTLLLTIQLHSPDISDFDPTTSIHQWNQGHHRRPNFMDRKVVTLGPPVDLQQMELSGDEHNDEQGEDAAVAITTPVTAVGDSDYDSSFSDLEEHEDEDSDMSLSAWFSWSDNGSVSTVLEYEDVIAYKKSDLYCFHEQFKSCFLEILYFLLTLGTEFYMMLFWCVAFSVHIEMFCTMSGTQYYANWIRYINSTRVTALLIKCFSINMFTL